MTDPAIAPLAPAPSFATLVRNLNDAEGFEPTLHQIVTSAADLVPCDWAAIAVTSRLATHPARWSTTTDEHLGEVVSRIAGTAGTSPGISAFETGETVLCSDLGADDRYPAYARGMLAETQVRAVLSLPIRVHDVTAGVLTLYAATAGAFDAEAVGRAQRLAEHAALAIAAELSDERADNLEIALQTSRTIGAAVGILTERLRIPPGQAFGVLSETSQRTNRKVSELAAELVETGTVPGLAVDDPAPSHT